MNAREDILDRIRTALADRPDPAPAERAYRRNLGRGPADLFAERVADYRATAQRVPRDDVAAAVGRQLARRGINRIAVPDGFPDAWLPALELVREPVDIGTLDRVGAALTTCAVAIAETGTIVLDAGPGMGPRALTLVPDYHLVVVRAPDIYRLVGDALATLDPARPITMISGPSATSDIELQRVEGVHGPRTLDVLIAE